MNHYAYDLDDTLIDTGDTIIRIIEKMGLSVADYREPYKSLRCLLDDGVISPEDYDLLLATAADQAQPIPQTVSMLKQTIRDYGMVHIVSTRSHMNTHETLNILGKILSPNEIYKVQIHWCKAPTEAIRKDVTLQGLGDAKLATFQYLANLGITHFLDDLMFNIKTILEKVPALVPVVVHQPWVIDRLYVPELMQHPRLKHLHLV